MTVHDQVMKSMTEMAAAFAAKGVVLAMPPASNATPNTTYAAIAPGTMLAAEFAFDARFTNPLHMFQGGFLCAALDEVFGPRTYMAAERPAVTIEMSTTFERPFVEKDAKIVIRAEVVAKTKSLLVLKAEVKTAAGKLVATSTTHSLVASEDRLRTPV